MSRPARLRSRSHDRYVAPRASVFALAPSLALALVAVIVATGCAKPGRGPAVPEDRTAVAVIPGFEQVRYFLPADADRMAADSKTAFERRAADRAERGVDPNAARHFLAISGGGDKGAFASGLLNGWTKAGTRPEFDVVTGVSTGSLVAPFAYLGPDYDGVIKSVYTSIGPDQIYDQRKIWAALYDDAMADSAPLQAMIAEYVTADVLSDVAAEYERGRWLLVVTADLDARRPVVWNMGAIARVGTPEALALFRKVLLSSASLPGLFPPVLFDVEADGESYQELHVDGGVMAQSFLFPPSFVAAVEAEGGVPRFERFVYLIRNARLQGDWAETPRRTLAIWARSNSALYTAGGIGDIYRIYTVAERYGMDFNLAVISGSFDAPHPTEFDTEFMNALYDFAYERAVEGYPWQKVPPGFERTLANPERAPGSAKTPAP